MLAVGTQRMPPNTQRSLPAALCGGAASLPVGKPGWSLPAAQWLLCVCSLQPLSVSLNGPFQGHSCASRPRPPAHNQPRAELRPAHGNVPARPASRSPDCLAEPGVQACAQRGDSGQSFGAHSSCALGSSGREGWEYLQGGRHVQAWARTSFSLPLTFRFYLCVPPI